MSTLPTSLSASQARKNFYTMLDEVNTKLKNFTITLNGQIKAVVINPDELESWRETLEIMSDKKLVKQIDQGLDDIKNNRVITHDQLLKELNITQKDLESE